MGERRNCRRSPRNNGVDKKKVEYGDGLSGGQLCTPGAEDGIGRFTWVVDILRSHLEEDLEVEPND